MLDSANNQCYNIGVKKKGRAMKQGSGKGREPIPGSEVADPLRDSGPGLHAGFIEEVSLC